MISLFNYIFEEAPKTDNAIYYQLGKNKHSWRRGTELTRINNKYHISGDNKRNGIIQYAKDTMPKILPNEKEVIHRKDWDIDGLIGETEKQLLHTAYWNLTEYIQKYHKRNHDILTIFECANSKPYSQAAHLKRFIFRFNGISDFACISNPGIVPMEYSHFYPYRYDEWNHFAEKDDIADKYCKVNIGRLIKYKKIMGYKHVIVLMQHPAPQKAIDFMYKENIDNCQDWLHIVSNESFRKTLKDKYYTKFNSNMGLVYQRALTQPYAMDAYMRVLSKCVDEDGRKTLDDVKNIMKEYSGSSFIKHMKEYIKDNDIPVIDLDLGAENKWDLLGPDDIDKSLLGKFNKFVKSYIEKLDITSSEDYHKDRVYFTVLDVLLDYHKDSLYLKDPDVEYWTMKTALDDYMKSDDNLKRAYSYLYYLESNLKNLKISKQDIFKDANKLGVLQLDDKRKPKQKSNE